MPIIQVPEALREKLGDKASEGLVTLIKDAQEEQKSHLLELVEERFARRVLESEGRSGKGLNETQTALRKEMHDGFADVRKEMNEGLSDVRKEMRGGFLRVEEKFTAMQGQITAQTRWLIALITFIAVAFKLIDLFVK